MHDCSRFNESKKDTLNIFVRDREQVIGNKKKNTSRPLVTTAYY